MQQSTKQRIWIFIIALLGAIAIGSALILLTIGFYSPKTQAVQNVSSASSEETYLYCVKEQDGKIQVFLNGQAEPLQTLDTDPSFLPQADQEMLKAGIYLQNDVELRKLLEDYDD